MEKGYIQINSICKIEDNWVDFYLATCTRCHQPFKIMEPVGHYMWWEWMKEV